MNESRTLYKLTDENGNTQGGMHWVVGITHGVNILGNNLCSNQVLHAYISPELATMMNPIHANYKSKQGFVCSGIIVADDGAKVGCKELTVTGVFEVPQPTMVSRIAFGILAAKEVHKIPSFVAWATEWLAGSDRSYTNAAKAAAAANAAANAANAYAADAYAANAADAYAANAAANAAYAAANAAANAAYANVAYAANANANAAYSAAAAANAAANAANVANAAAYAAYTAYTAYTASYDPALDLNSIAIKAMEVV